MRDIVQRCFDNAVFRLNKDGMVNDAGHSSSAITDRYIDIEKRERHASAKKKKLRPLE